LNSQIYKEKGNGRFTQMDTCVCGSGPAGGPASYS
jgi:hypothetical protein